MRLALFQPDIPQNVGAMLRLGACLDVAVDIIEPCGFPFSDKAVRRAGMDYLEGARLTRHASWQKFEADLTGSGRRLVLLTTRAHQAYTDFAFSPDDTLIFGRESAGAPDFVHDRADRRLIIPMAAGRRSLNVAVSAAMVLGEALRQTDAWPPRPPAEAQSTVKESPS